MRDTRRLAVFDCHYERQGELGDPCVYCGVESSGWDHVPPLHYAARLSQEDRAEARLRKVPSCHECNTLLGGAVLTTLAARRSLVRERLQRKYAHLLSIPEWSDDELAQLTGRTREDVRAHLVFARHLKQRLGSYR